MDRIINSIRMQLDEYFDNINSDNLQKSYDISRWILQQRILDELSLKLARSRNNKNEHPLILIRGEVYVVEYGVNVGFEFKDRHLGLIIQNDTGNKYGATTIVLPITDYGDGKKFDKNIHIQLSNRDFEFVDRRGLDKDPSMLKVANIRTRHGI